MEHLRDSGLSYISVLQTYVSDRICKDKNKIKLDDIKASDYF